MSFIKGVLKAYNRVNSALGVVDPIGVAVEVILEKRDAQREFSRNMHQEPKGNKESLNSNNAKRRIGF